MSFVVIEGDVTLRDATGSEKGVAGNPLRTDPTGTTAQPVTDNGGSLTIDATSLPLPTGAATEATLASIDAALASIDTAIANVETSTANLDVALSTRAADRTNANAPFATRLSDGAAFYDATKTGQLPSALVGGRLDVNTGAWLGSTAPSVGQKAQSSSIPVVVASDQSTLPVKSEIQLDYDSGAGVQQLSVVGIALPASGGAVAGGTSTNPLRVDPTGTTTQPTSNAAASQADGHSASIGATGDADTANTVIGRLKQIITRLAGGLPAALVGGRLDINIGSWFGSTAPTVGQKAMADSLPVVFANDQSTLPVSSGATEEATFTVIATAAVLGNGKSLLSLYNPSGSTVKLKLREYYVRNAQTTAVTGVAAQLEIRKVISGTAPSGGTSLTANIIAHDSNDSLGAGVLAHTGATLTGEGTVPLDIMRISSDEWGPGTLDQEGAQQTISNYLPARVKRDAQQKPIVVMNAGQGVTLKCVTNTTAGSFDIIFVFTQV